MMSFLKRISCVLLSLSVAVCGNVAGYANEVEHNGGNIEQETVDVEDVFDMPVATSIVNSSLSRAGGATFTSLRSKFPNGAYWNHVGGSNNPMDTHGHPALIMIIVDFILMIAIATALAMQYNVVALHIKLHMIYMAVISETGQCIKMCTTLRQGML